MLPQPHTYLHYIRSRLKLMFGIYVPYPNIQRTHKHEECFCVKAGAVYRYCLYLCTSYVEMYLMFTLLCVRIEIGRLFLFCFFFFLNLCLFGAHRKHLFNKLHLSKLYTLFTVEYVILRREIACLLRRTSLRST